MKIFAWPAQRRQIEKFFQRSFDTPESVRKSVAEIIDAVRHDGDRAVAELTKQFDRVELTPKQFDVSKSELKRAWDATPADIKSALQLAAKRIEAFHRKQRLAGWSMNDPALGRMEMRVEPIERAGVYAPGGKAAYPSTVLMDVIPARVAGVKEIILVTPPGPTGMPSQAVLAAAYLTNVDRVLRIGGAQAIAALAYGTKTIPRVDKIVGPGNIYVATAKQMLFGQIGIDSVAGPTEVLIIADDSARLDWIAADLLAQAEHDQEASAGVILIGGTRERARALIKEIHALLRTMPRRAIAQPAMKNLSYTILAPDETAAAEIANFKAPEHLQIMTRGARKLAKRIRHAGAIFIGAHTPEPVGDYIAGPNHTLPTGGTARFFSPLSVWTFYKTCHTIEATKQGLARHADAIVALAESEGLHGHAASIRKRMKPKG